MRFIIVILALSCFSFISTREEQSSNIVIVNDFNATDRGMRKKKQELFAQLADSATKTIAREAATKWNLNAVIIDNPGFELHRNDMERLMKEHNASRVIFLDWVEASFYQTRVEVEETDSGKDRTAFYDICAEVKVTHMDPYKRMYDVQKKVCEPFTDRSVVSGLLAAGPDVVGKKKHTFPMMDKAAVALIRQL